MSQNVCHRMCGLQKSQQNLLRLGLHQEVLQVLLYKCTETAEKWKLVWSKLVACAALRRCRQNEVASIKGFFFSLFFFSLFFFSILDRLLGKKFPLLPKGGSSLPGLNTHNFLLSPPLTPEEVFRRICLGGDQFSCYFRRFWTSPSFTLIYLYYQISQENSEPASWMSPLNISLNITVKQNRETGR